MVKSDIKAFIDFFFDASQRIRKVKPVFIRGKDGKLVERALKIFSRSQLEMLAVWFLEKKPALSPTVGAMLSNAVLDELKQQIIRSEFWSDLDKIYDKYYRSQLEKSAVAELRKTLINKYKNY